MPITLTSNSQVVRHFKAVFHYEEWTERRWRFWNRTRRSWWAMVDMGHAGSWFGIGDTFKEVNREIIPGIRFMLEDDTSAIFVQQEFAPLEVPR